MANRAANASLTDANSQEPRSFVASPGIYATNTTTTISGSAGILHGFLVVTAAAGAYTLTLYDASTTAAAGLVTTTTVGVLNSTTASGALSFQPAGDIIFNNGLVAVASGGTTGNIRIIYL